MCMCANSHAHMQGHTHTHSLGPRYPCLLPKGTFQGASRKIRLLWPPRLVSRKDAGDCRAVPGFETELLMTCATVPWPKRLLFKKSSLPPLTYLPKAPPLGQVADSSTCSIFTCVQEHRLALCHRTTRRRVLLATPTGTQINPFLCIWCDRGKADQTTPRRAWPYKTWWWQCLD